uniref:Annexin (Annexin) Family putative n=1 Tax=Albugo laibachii Nc14 TaxID=890382 RepID=F0X230_9STRA|nr:Annexin (Annexin) Family putative [Albugo laibachii Nc14]|eukprot:CCA27898.1 Annexin (Annexin) Family putative [Albugo laibachii Nc14]
MAMLQAPRQTYHPSIHTPARAEADAIALYNAGQGRLGTEERTFIRILVESSPSYLCELNASYSRMYHNNIVKAIQKEFSFDAKRSLVLIVRLVVDPFPAIAEIFENTMKGFGTNEKELSIALVRYQNVLDHIKNAYKRLYGKDLRNRIHGETSGYYRQLLLAIYDAPQDPPTQQNVDRSQSVMHTWQYQSSILQHHVSDRSPSMSQMYPSQ